MHPATRRRRRRTEEGKRERLRHWFLSRELSINSFLPSSFSHRWVRFTFLPALFILSKLIVFKVELTSIPFHLKSLYSSDRPAFHINNYFLFHNVPQCLRCSVNEWNWKNIYLRSIKAMPSRAVSADLTVQFPFARRKKNGRSSRKIVFFIYTSFPRWENWLVDVSSTLTWMTLHTRRRRRCRGEKSWVLFLF